LLDAELMTDLGVGRQRPHASSDVGNRTAGQIFYAGNQLKTIVGHLFVVLKKSEPCASTFGGTHGPLVSGVWLS